MLWMKDNNLKGWRSNTWQTWLLYDINKGKWKLELWHYVEPCNWSSWHGTLPVDQRLPILVRSSDKRQYVLKCLKVTGDSKNAV